MVEILALFMGMGLAAWGAYLIVARGKRQLDAAVAYRGVARTLELDVDTRGVSLQGHLDDRRLWVGEVMVGHGPDRRTAIWGVVDLRRPMGLGLQIRRRGLSERVFRRNRAPSIELGHAIDRRVEVLGDEHARVRTLLGSPPVRLALEGLVDAHADVVVTDSSVRVHLARPLTTERALDNLVQRMRTLADALAIARQEVDAPERLARLVPGWAAVADELGLTFEAWLPAIVGEVAGCRLVMTVTREERDYAGDLRLYFPAHRPIGLRLRPQVEPDGYWSVGQDIQLGHGAFDDRFVVKGWDPGKIRDLLGADVRLALIRALDCGRLHVEDARLHLSGVQLEAEAVAEAIKCCLAVASALGWSEGDDRAAVDLG